MGKLTKTLFKIYTNTKTVRKNTGSPFDNIMSNWKNLTLRLHSGVGTHYAVHKSLERCRQQKKTNYR